MNEAIDKISTENAEMEPTDLSPFNMVSILQDCI